jgi:elongation factor P
LTPPLVKSWSSILAAGRNPANPQSAIRSQLMLAKDAKPGAIVLHLDAPHIIETVHVQSPSARGGNTLYKFRARNLVTQQKADFTCKGTDMLPEADFQRREVTLMYSDGEQVYFLDTADYNQYAIPAADISEQMQYVTEGLTGMLVLVYNDECVGLQLPPSVELKIIQCDPGVKGNSATSRTKPATLETGYVVHVPEYMKEGELIKVDTRTGEFTGRA